MSFDLNENTLLIISVYGGVVLASFWLAMVIWAYRDMRARSRDTLAALLVTLLVAILTVPGLFIYIMLRPRETLSEAYERSLEEEALLQEIEEKPTCPGCGQRVHPDWQACPYCHTRLKKPCVVCHQLLELSWTLCPHCASIQNQYIPEDDVVNSSRHIQRKPPRENADSEPLDIPDKWLAPSQSRKPAVDDRHTAGSPEYIEDDYS